MQVIAESLAMGSFKMMKRGTSDELLRQIVELTAQDEARHVSYGLIYMKEELPKMAEDERNAVEDFALAAVGILAGPDNEAAMGAPLLAIMEEVGIDLEVAVPEMAAKLGTAEARAERFNPFQEYVIPQLKRIDLITERTAPGYAELGLAV
jgi:hypothetical protein